MGKLRKAASYNEGYRRQQRRFMAPPDKHPSHGRWTALARAVPPKASVLDLGCGAGHFAEVLRSEGGEGRYLGLDYSIEAVKLARQREVSGATFKRMDLRKLQRKLVSRFDVIVSGQVFEHLEDDLALVDLLAGKLVLFTVPTFDSAGHVRWFPQRQTVVDRYTDRFHGLVIGPVGRSWFCCGVAKGASEVC
tara:strand:- start:1020 stop:1595 length:576 start_codon:yes stop_codon:yes gene_type:complete